MKASSRIRKPKVPIVRQVTAEHGAIFAEEWFESSSGSLEVHEACGMTGIIVWPEDDAVAQDAYIEITDEITERTLTAVKAAIAEAFVREATAVLNRERRPPRVTVMPAENEPSASRG